MRDGVLLTHLSVSLSLSANESLSRKNPIWSSSVCDQNWPENEINDYLIDYVLDPRRDILLRCTE